MSDLGSAGCVGDVTSAVRRSSASWFGNAAVQSAFDFNQSDSMGTNGKLTWLYKVFMLFKIRSSEPAMSSR